MFKMIVDICRFRSAPEMMPYSIPLLLGITCVNFATLFFVILLAAASIPVALGKSLLLMTLIAGFTIIALMLKEYPERFVQALSVLYATQTLIIVAFALPCVILSWFLLDNPSNIFYWAGFSICGLLILAASLWLFFVYAKIFQHSLEITINQSMLVALLLFTINAVVFALLNHVI